MNAVLNTFTNETTVAELVLASQTGDREAFGELCARYERTIYTIAYNRLNNHAEAQELVQDVFIQAMTKLDQLRTPECFGGWLRSITARMAINRAVRHAPEYATEPEAFDYATAETNSPLDNMLRGETQRKVREGMKRLGKLDRETLKAFYVRGHSLVEMATEFDAPIGTIKRRLHVARKRLALELAGYAPA